MGAAIFVEAGGRVSLRGGVRFANNRLVPGEAGGNGAGDGRAYGIDIFLMPGAELGGVRPSKADIFVADEKKASPAKENPDSL